MALLSISTLLGFPTVAEIRAKFVSMLLTMGIPADKWRAGGVASSILTVVANEWGAAAALLQPAIASQFLGTATGDWLTLLALFVYNVTRAPATFAQGTLTLTNIGGGVYTFGAGEATFQNQRTLLTYTNTDPFTLGAGSSGSPTVLAINVQAQTAGAASSANPGEITILVTQMLGVSCTNASSLAGLDEQTDASLIQACQSKLGSLSPGGPSAAYQYAVDTAVNAVTGLPVGVNRRNVQLSANTGTVNVIVASPSGPVAADDITGIVNNIVAVAVPDAVTFSVTSATPIAYSPTLTVWAQGLPGVDPVTLGTQIATALTSYIETYPIGGLAKGGGTSALWASGIEGAIKSVSPAIFAVDGATNLPLAPAQVATDSITSITVQMVPAP